MKFKNLIEVSNYFADSKKATEYLVRLRWSGNVVCIHCTHDKVYELKGANPRFKCAKCRKQFSAIKGTIFENSPISLQKWFTAVYLITSHKKGISSHQLAKDLSISQKSGWFVLQRIRFALQSGSFNHSPDGIIQADETFVGGDYKNKHHKKVEKKSTWGNKNTTPKGRSVQTKTAVAGILETGGQVKASVVPDTKKATLQGFIRANVKEGATIVTDEWASYTALRNGFNHKIVNHTQGQYVVNGFHTNGIENFWSHFKRSVYGIYHHVSPKHLDKYIDESEFRYNTRKMGEVDRFDKMLTLSSKRLTYAQLISNGEKNEPTDTPDWTKL